MAKDEINWSPIGGQPPTGEGLGVAPDIEVEKPRTTNRITESTISSASKSGLEARNVNYWDRVKQMGQSAINPLAMALLGAVRSLPTIAKTEGYTNPLIPLIVGSGAGLQSGRDMKSEALDNSKVEERFPEFTEQNPWAKGMTVREFRQNAPIFSAIEKKNRPKISIGMVSRIRAAYPDMSDEEIYSLDSDTANKLFAEAGKNQRDLTAVVASTDPMLGEFSRTINVPPEVLVGKPQNKVMEMYSRIRARKERVTWESKPFEINGVVFGTTQYSPETGSLRYTMKAGGGKAASTLQSLTTLRNNLNDLYDEAIGFDTGRFKGVFDYGKVLAGSSPDMRAFDNIVKIQRSNIAKVVGNDVGNLAQQEQVVAENALPEVITKPGQMADTREELESKRRLINNIIDSKIQAIANTYGASIFGAGGGGDTPPAPSVNRKAW